MKRALLAISCLVIACTACSTDYVAQCKEVYTKINSLPCVNASNEFDLNIYCPEEYNENGKDYDEFFSCIERNIFCSETAGLRNNVSFCMGL